MNRTFLQAASTIAVAFGGFGASSAAFAQQTDAAAQAPAAGDIIVTARKRSETLQDVPLSIQAFSEQELARSDIADLDELAALSPGVQLFENVDRGYGQVFIRGMQSTPPVGDTSRELASVFIDGIYYVGGVSGLNTDNIERVEVIKGPQSALYGRATFSGAINFITKTPGNALSGKIRLKAAEDDNYEVAGSIDLPLAPDILSARLSGSWRTFGGQYTNQLTGNPLGEEEDWSLSGQVFFTPAPGFSMKLTASYLEQDDGAPASVLTGKTPTQTITTPSGSTFYDGVLKWDGIVEQNEFPDPSGIFAVPPVPPALFTNFDQIGILENGLKRDFFFSSWDVGFEGDRGYAVNYLGSYSKDDAARLYDFELSRENNYFGSRQTDSDAHSHELRFASPEEDRFSWLLGAFYMKQELYERDPGFIGGADLFPFPPFNLTGDHVAIIGTTRVIVDLEIENKALFGAFDFDFTDALTLSVEGRYQVDKLTDPNVPSEKTKAFLPRAILEYQASPDVLLYAVAAKGLRPTVINTQFIQRPAEEQAALREAFPELTIAATAPKETIWSYEIGAKTTLMNGLMTFNINGYYSDWKDRQDLQSLLFDFGSGVASTLVTVNGSDVEAYGIEAQAAIQLSDAFNLSGNFAWNHTALVGPGADANIARFLLDSEPDGQRLPQTPEFSGTLIGDYRQDGVIGDAGIFLRAEGIWVGSRYASTLNFTETGSSFDVNLRAGIETERITFGLFVENLFNDKTFESLRSNADCATTTACTLRAYEAVLPRKRQIGVIAEARF